MKFALQLVDLHPATCYMAASGNSPFKTGVSRGAPLASPASHRSTTSALRGTKLSYEFFHSAIEKRSPRHPSSRTFPAKRLKN